MLDPGAGATRLRRGSPILLCHEGRLLVGSAGIGRGLYLGCEGMSMRACATFGHTLFHIVIGVFSPFLKNFAVENVSISNWVHQVEELSSSYLLCT